MTDEQEDNSEEEDDPTLEKPKACDACSYETEHIERYLRCNLLQHRKKADWFCALCANTFAGNAHVYPEFHPNKEAMHQINYVGNTILNKIALLKFDVEDIGHEVQVIKREVM